MTMRSFFTALLTFAIAMLLMAGGGVAWVLSQSPLSLKDGGVLTNPSASIFVSRQAPAMVSLLVNPDRLTALLQSQTSLNDRRTAQQELATLKSGLLAATGLNYRRDIRPWLDEEITIALTSLDYDRNPENGQQPGYLLAATAKNGDLAREFLQLLYAKRAIAGKADLVFEQYKGVSLVYPRRRKDQSIPVASAVVGDRYVLFANHPKVLRDAINNVQVPKLNLSNSPAYQTALETSEQPHIGLVYVNLLSVAKVFETDPKEAVPTITLALTLAEDGLVADTTVTGLLNTVQSRPQLNQPVEALGYLPPRTSLTAASTDLSGFWQSLTTGFGEANPVVDLFENAIAQLQEPLGVDLPTDVFSWVHQDYAVSLLPNRDWILAARRGEETDAAIAHLDEIAQAQNLSLAALEISETPVTVWTELITAGGRVDAAVRGAHATVGDYELLSNSLTVITNMVTEQRSSLLNSQDFQGAIATLPVPNTGYFYLDWPRVKPLLEQRFPLLKVADVAAQPLLKNLQSLILTSNGTEQGVSRATVFFKNRS